MKYYYFHGYGSSPNAIKGQIMQNILGKDNVSIPDFNLQVEEISDLFDRLVYEIESSNDDILIVGSSLGGLYALYVSSKLKHLKIKCNIILLNPALMPMLIVPKVDKNVPISSIITAQKLSLYAYEHYKKENVTVWVTEDSLINHSELTKPFFHKGLKEYIEISPNVAHSHEFIGFENVFKEYVENNS